MTSIKKQECYWNALFCDGNHYDQIDELGIDSSLGPVFVMMWFTREEMDRSVPNFCCFVILLLC